MAMPPAAAPDLNASRHGCPSRSRRIALLVDDDVKAGAMTAGAPARADGVGGMAVHPLFERQPGGSLPAPWKAAAPGATLRK